MARAVQTLTESVNKTFQDGIHYRSPHTPRSSIAAFGGPVIMGSGACIRLLNLICDDPAGWKGVLRFVP